MLSINVPMTFPPFPVNGALVSGVFLPPGATFTHPPELQHELDGWGGFPVNGLEWAEGGDLADLFEEAALMTKQQTMIAERLIDKEQWDVALVAFMAPIASNTQPCTCSTPRIRIEPSWRGGRVLIDKGAEGGLRRTGLFAGTPYRQGLARQHHPGIRPWLPLGLAERGAESDPRGAGCARRSGAGRNRCGA